MSIHAWRILAGAIRLITLYLAVFSAWFVISFFDEKWNAYLWRHLFHRDIAVLGFIVTILLFYLVGGFSETKIGIWIDKKISKIPVIGRWIVIINPQVRELIRNSKGALHVPFYQDGWRVAVLTIIHKTKHGYLGTVGIIGLPPIQEQIDEKSRVKVREINENGKIRFELISLEIAIKQEFTYGVSVSADAYNDVVETTFGRLVPYLNLKDFRGKDSEI